MREKKAINDISPALVIVIAYSHTKIYTGNPLVNSMSTTSLKNKICRVSQSL